MHAVGWGYIRDGKLQRITAAHLTSYVEAKMRLWQFQNHVKRLNNILG